MRPWRKRLREPAPPSELPPLDVTVEHTSYGALTRGTVAMSSSPAITTSAP